MEGLAAYRRADEFEQRRAEEREAAAELRRERVELERYRGRYSSREELLAAMYVEYATPPIRRKECMVDTEQSEPHARED